MGRADNKKKTFKKEVKEIYEDYQPFVWAIAVGLVILGFTFFFSLQKYTESTKWDINTLVEGEYAAELKEDPQGSFVVVTGDIKDVELVRLQVLVSNHIGEETPVYLMEDGTSTDTIIPFYEQYLERRVEWRDGKHEVITFAEYPDIEANVSAFSDWDTYSETTHLKDGLLRVDGYVSPIANGAEVIAQLKGVSDMIDDLNEENEEATYETKHFDMQYGNNRIHFRTDMPNVLGKGEVFVLKTQRTPSE